MSDQTNLIFFRCLCDKTPNPYACISCPLRKRHGMRADVCLSLNWFRSFVQANAQRKRFIDKRFRNGSSLGFERSREVEVFALWLFLSSKDDPWNAGSDELANAITDDEPYSKGNLPPRGIRVFVSKWKSSIVNYHLVRYMVERPTGGDECDRVAFFLNEILPELRTPVRYGKIEAVGCLDARQLSILKLLVREFKAPFSTYIVDRRRPNDTRRWKKVRFPNWKKLILSKDSLPKGQRYQTHLFIPYLLDLNASREAEGSSLPFVPGLKGWEIRYLLEFDDLSCYTPLEIISTGIAPLSKKLGVYPSGEVKIFKLLRKK
jgi:hypothetical protein